MPSGNFRSLPAIQRAIVACGKCPRLRSHCIAVARTRRRAFLEQRYWGRPVPGFGDPGARLLVVGLAPAAHGANRTGRMFTGDASGDWLYEAMHRYGFASQPSATARGDGLRLIDCYVTAAARCAPPGNRPERRELDNCRPFLQAEIRHLARVRIVLVLGRIAWESWLRAAGLWDILPARQRPPFAHGARTVLPSGLTLLCSYHPSRQNTQTGRLTRSMWHAIFQQARSLVNQRVATAEPGRARHPLPS